MKRGAVGALPLLISFACVVGACSSAPDEAAQSATDSVVGRAPPRCWLEPLADCTQSEVTIFYGGVVVLGRACAPITIGGVTLTGRPSYDWLADLHQMAGTEAWFETDAKRFIPLITPAMMSGAQPFCIYSGTDSDGYKLDYTFFAAHESALCAALGTSSLDAYCDVFPVSPAQNPCGGCGKPF
jgi:hypothetical protein